MQLTGDRPLCGALPDERNEVDFSTWLLLELRIHEREITDAAKQSFEPSDVASAATVLPVAGYAARILGATRAGATVAGWMALLYGLLYVLLQLEDLALLIGSLAIFLGLVATMYFTRSVDWYATGHVEPSPK